MKKLSKKLKDDLSIALAKFDSLEAGTRQVVGLQVNCFLFQNVL